MYLEYYGLKKKPFDLMPDPRMVFMSEAHQEALAILKYGIIERKGFLLLTGDVGTGKTSLLHLVTRSLADRVHICFISNPTLSVSDFYFTLASKFKLPPFKVSKAHFLEGFAAFLERCRQKKERALLIIDEAHALPVKLLEEVRLLSNQEYQRYGLLSIFLVGQPELNQRLGHERLLPLRQRLAIRFHLTPFSPEETRDYIAFRLRRAGTQHRTLFSEEALSLIYKATQGIPRLINILCDQALLTGFSENKPIINGDIIRQCLQELHIPGETELLPLPPQKARWYRNKLLWTGGAALLLLGASVWLWHTDFLRRLDGALQHLGNWLSSIGVL